MATALGKGEIAEEALRSYFIEQDYFVVRSLFFTYNEFTITDIDLWLYYKSSPFTRERTNVDIKNTKAPQVFERIVWAKGIQVTLGLERAIVATTSNRKELKGFGVANDIIILDGDFLSLLINKGVNSHRIPEEDFISDVVKENPGKGGENWKERYITSKARLLSKFNFDGCNEYLREIQYFLEQSMVRAESSLIPLRLLYINIAFFLISVDFISKNHLSLEHKSRIEFLMNGFNYGERGKERTESITNAAIKLAASVIASPSIAKTLQMEIDKQTKNRPVEILADFFSRTTNTESLFKIAKLFEAHSYAQSISSPSQLPEDLQSIIGLLTDFFRMDRKRILSF